MIPELDTVAAAVWHDSDRLVGPRENTLVQAVDQHDHPVGAVERGRVFQVDTAFRVVHIMIVNDKGELLLQKIAANHGRHPGFWGSSVAGYVEAGESYAVAARRKLASELRLNAKPEHVGRTSMLDEGKRKFIGVYTLRHDGPFSYNRDDASAVEFVSASRFRHPATLRRKLTPTFLHVVEFFLERRRS